MVIVHDDVTDLVSAQRMAAWGDVARRVAHEIKNPLTPIQLTIDRIKTKFTDQIKSNDQEGFKENHTEFFKFIDMFSLEVSGSSALKDLDPERDNRLNTFKYTMYSRYINGLNEGKTPSQLLKATKGNKDFIGYDFHTFVPNMRDVFISIRNSITTDNKLKGNTFKSKKDVELELGKTITATEYLEYIGKNNLNIPTNNTESKKKKLEIGEWTTKHQELYKKYKIEDLKKILRTMKLNVSGTKKMLINRLINAPEVLKTDSGVLV